VVYRQPANGANTNYQGSFEMVVYNTFPAVAGVFGVIFFLFIIILILKCCTEDRRPKVTRRRRLRSSYENLPRTSVPTTQHRPAPTSVEDITDIDGIVVVPEPGEASPVVVPPYPVEPRHPTPHGGPPGPGFATNHPPYPTHTPHPMPGKFLSLTPRITKKLFA
jgi:hypothetical protein